MGTAPAGDRSRCNPVVVVTEKTSRRNPAKQLCAAIVLCAGLLATRTSAQAAEVAANVDQRFQQVSKAGLDAYTSGDFPQAIQQLTTLIREYGTVPGYAKPVAKARYLLALSLVREKNWRQALTEIDTFLGSPAEDIMGSDREELLFWKPLAHLQLGESEEAAQGFQNFYRLYPASTRRSSAGVLTASALLSNQKYDDAAAYLNSIASQLSGNARQQAIILQLYSLIQAGKTSEAVKLVNDTYPQLDQQPQVVSYSKLLIELATKLAAENNALLAVNTLKLIRSRDELIELQRKRLTELERAIAVLNERPDRVADLIDARGVKDRIDADLKSLVDQPLFDAQVRLEQASRFIELGRNLEAALLLESMLRDLPQNPVIEQASQTLLRCWYETGNWPRIIELADVFAERFPDSEELPAALFMKAQALAELNDYDASAAIFAEIATRFPDDALAPRALFSQGFILATLQEYDRALAIFEGMPGKFPNDSMADTATFWQGNTLSMAGKSREAIERLAEYQTKFPDGVEKLPAQYRIAYNHHALREFDQSIPQLTAFLAVQSTGPDASEARLLLADGYFAQGQTEEGLAVLRDVPPADAAYFEEAWFKTAKVFRLQERIEELRAHLADFVENYPTSGRVAEALYWLGWSHRDDPAKAREVYWDAITRLGNDPANAGIEDILLGLQKIPPSDDTELARELKVRAEQAESAGEFVLALRLNWARAQLVRGTAPEQARYLLISQSNKINPATTDPRIVADVADALFDDGRTELAAAIYLDLVRWNPNSGEKARGLARLAELANRAGDSDAALRWYERVIEEAPDSTYETAALLDAARLLAAADRSGEAITYLDLLLRKKTTPAQTKAAALVLYGDLLAQQGDYAKAIACYQRVYVLYGRWDEHVAPAYLRSAKAFESLGDTASARRTYEEFAALERFQSTDAAREATTALERLPAEGNSNPAATTQPEAAP